MSDLVNVRVAASFAAKFSSPGELAGSYLLDGLQASLDEIVREAEPLIAEESGFTPRVPAVARVLSREQWARANVASTLTLMNPLLDKVESKLSAKSPPGARMAYGSLMGAQLGTVLGFLSQRVLGQYDILMGHQDQVWFVGPNIVAIERQHGFIPRDFRLWVALHELTHRAQFEANPWVRPYFLSSVDKMINLMDMDAKTVLDRMIAALKGGGGKRQREALFAQQGAQPGMPMAFRLLGDEQLEQFNKLQAFMSVIEGHGNFVMDKAAQGRIPSQPRMSQLFRGSKSTLGPVAKLMAKVLGFELKKAQYEQGQRFFNAVFEAAGPDGVRRCFESADMLPTLDEVKSPDLWLQRVPV